MKQIESRHIYDPAALYFVFDVESAGLLGAGFAYGFVVVDGKGNEIANGYGAAQPDEAVLPDWVKENVLPALWGWTETGGTGHITLREKFWAQWRLWQNKGAVMVGDWAWPVEANFLLSCAFALPTERQCEFPAPLLDVSSFLAAAGVDPNINWKRETGELPIHNPLCDARHSARLLLGAIELFTSEEGVRCEFPFEPNVDDDEADDDD